ncbi:MAG: RagB/SusD family nutrient uptake outer membrane protein [Flaviaesturariibacter sp.]|nr:RagB/SusD family nutrient uptake outer membrane protein [Flaviaesturariibacter sp.]
MNYKYYNKITLLVAASFMLALGSCKKFLDQQPITSVGPELVFKDVESTRSALLGVYQQLAGDNGYGLKLSLYFAVGNDETQGPTGAADAGRRDFPLYATTAGNTQMYGAYQQLFRGIQYANLCIANIPSMGLYANGSEQEKKQLKRMLGEALTLRAQFYMEAIRNWGDLPMHFEPAEVLATKDAFPVRTDRDVIYDRLLEDLKTATDLVPWRNEVATIGDGQDERITKGTVKGLRARIALYRGGYSLRQDGSFKRAANYQTFYQIARDETNDIISSNQHSLNPSFRDLWKNQVGSRVSVDPNGELMFQVSAIGKSATADAKVGYNSGPTVVDLATQAGATGTSSVFILPTYFYLFDSSDTRRDVTCVSYSDTLAPDGSTFYKRGVQITGIFDGKYRRDWLNPPLAPGTYANNYTGYKWQLLRYSDVLLMFAEADNELNGPTVAGYNAVNMVRRRGYGKTISLAGQLDLSGQPIDLSGLSKQDFFKAIVRERSLELGAEGVRKFDLIRWNMLATAINETRANLIKMSASQIMNIPTYMAPPPSYVLNTATLPTKLYYRARTSSDVMTFGGLIVNSLYKPAPASTPAGTVSMNWIQTGIATGTGASVVTNHFANGFVTGKSELLPIPQDAITAYGSFSANMPQNPNY